MCSTGSKHDPPDIPVLEPVTTKCRELDLSGLMGEGAFLARAKRGSILEAIDEIRIARGFDQADGPDVSEHLDSAEKSLLAAVALIEEAGS